MKPLWFAHRSFDEEFYLMRSLSILVLCLVQLVLGSSCMEQEPTTGAQQEQTIKEPRAPAPAVRVMSNTVPPTAAQRGYHRYRGTLGGRPVQLELTVVANTQSSSYTAGSADLEGFFRYLDSGEGLSIGASHKGFPASQPLEIEEWADYPARTERVMLCTDQPIGPLLTGTYMLGRDRVSFRVQEDYSDCLRYEVLHEETEGPPHTWHEEIRSSSVSRDYLHLLGSDTLRPVRARMQCPLPAQRERARAALAKRTNSGTHLRQFMWVQLNESNLLAYEREEREEWLGSRYYEATFRQVLYDLRTGRELEMMAQLRPGGRRRLQLLLTRQALADTAYARNRDHWRVPRGAMPLPDRGFAVTPEGLVATYAEHESEEQMYGYGQTITWANVRPLLRPYSPLHRLLQAKGR
jgi:hypothetical protein